MSHNKELQRMRSDLAQNSDNLVVEDRPRHGPTYMPLSTVRVKHNGSTAAVVNKYRAAVDGGAFDDSDAAAVKGLDDLGGPRPYDKTGQKPASVALLAQTRPSVGAVPPHARVPAASSVPGSATIRAPAAQVHGHKAGGSINGSGAVEQKPLGPESTKKIISTEVCWDPKKAAKSVTKRDVYLTCSDSKEGQKYNAFFELSNDMGRLTVHNLDTCDYACAVQATAVFSFKDRKQGKVPDATYSLEFDTPKQCVDFVTKLKELQKGVKQGGVSTAPIARQTSHKAGPVSQNGASLPKSDASLIKNDGLACQGGDPLPHNGSLQTGGPLPKDDSLLLCNDNTETEEDGQKILQKKVDRVVSVLGDVEEVLLGNVLPIESKNRILHGLTKCAAKVQASRSADEPVLFRMLEGKRAAKPQESLMSFDNVGETSENVGGLVKSGESSAPSKRITYTAEEITSLRGRATPRSPELDKATFLPKKMPDGR